MNNRSKIVIATIFTALAATAPAATAKEFFIAAGSTITGFSSSGLCEASGFGSSGCLRFGIEDDCGGYSLYVGKFSHAQMVDEYRQGEKITIRHLNSNGSFGDVICTYN